MARIALALRSVWTDPVARDGVRTLLQSLWGGEIDAAELATKLGRRRLP